MSQEPRREADAVSSKVGCRGEEPVGSGGCSLDTCAGAGQLQVEIQVLGAEHWETFHTQTVTEVLGCYRRARNNVQRKEPSGITISKGSARGWGTWRITKGRVAVWC